MARTTYTDLLSKTTCPVYYIKQGFSGTKGNGMNTCIEGNSSPKQFTQGKPFSGSVLPNCTGYAQGRQLECMHAKQGTSYKVQKLTHDASQWYSDAKSAGLKTNDSTPVLGAIACFDSHVAVVEEINGSNIVITESNWGSTGKYFWNRRTVTIKSCKGFIYPEAEVSIAGTSTAWTATKWKSNPDRDKGNDAFWNNVQMVAKACQSDGWALKATCALLGNITMESNVNPQLGESGGSGFGLTQWTPKSKLEIRIKALGIATPTDINSWGNAEMKVLLKEMIKQYNGSDTWYQWHKNKTRGYTLTADEFKQNTNNLTLDELTTAFMWEYEVPNEKYAHLDKRKEWTKKIYEYLQKYWGSVAENSEPSGASVTVRHLKTLKPLWRRF